MGISTWIAIGVIVLIVGLAAGYVIKSKKKGSNKCQQNPHITFIFKICAKVQFILLNLYNIKYLKGRYAQQQEIAHSGTDL